MAASSYATKPVWLHIVTYRTDGHNPGVHQLERAAPPSPDAPERFNSSIAFPVLAVLVAGQPGMLWASVVKVGGALGLFVRG